VPGLLLRCVARTAVIAGTATAVSNRVSRLQTERWSEQGTMPGAYAAPPQAAAPPPPAAPPPSAAEGDTIEQLRQLGELRDKGVLTDEEFAAQKAQR
jgi:Short C-terminal domain